LGKEDVYRTDDALRRWLAHRRSTEFQLVHQVFPSVSGHHIEQDQAPAE
jgi:hypothetical protein